MRRRIKPFISINTRNRLEHECITSQPPDYPINWPFARRLVDKILGARARHAESATNDKVVPRYHIQQIDPISKIPYVPQGGTDLLPIRVDLVANRRISPGPDIQIWIHEGKVVSTSKVLPRPSSLTSQTRRLQASVIKRVICVVYNNLVPGGFGRQWCRGRHPVRSAAVKRLIRSSFVLERHSHGMLFWHRGFMILHKIDHMILPFC